MQNLHALAAMTLQSCQVFAKMLEDKEVFEKLRQNLKILNSVQHF